MLPIYSPRNISAIAKGTHVYDIANNSNKSAKRGCKKSKKNFFRPKIFNNLNFGHFWSKIAKTKNFGQKIYFLIGNDSEWSKTYFKIKISISKNFSYYVFSLES